MQTWEFNDFGLISNIDISKKLLSISKTIKWISITGGDPLHLSHRGAVLDLITLLAKLQYKINIEASGQVIVHNIFNAVHFISWDIKLPSTGVRFNHSLLEEMIKLYNVKLQVKAVVQDRKDFFKLLEIRKKNMNYEFENWVITPAFCTNETNIKKRFELINELNENEGNLFRVIGQQHKWIYGALATDV